MPRLSKEQELLAFFVKNCGSPPGRTRLMKLLYLADYEARRYMGRPITNVKYIWYDHGPWNHQFFGWLDALKETGVIVERPVQYPNGMVGYAYERGEGAPPIPTSLTPAEAEIVSYVARRYSQIDLRELLDDVVYETEPMRDAKKRKAHNGALKMELVDNAMADQLGVPFEELLERRRRVKAGEYTKHEDAMKELDAALARVS